MRVLRSDPSDPSSYANSLGDDRYVKLAAAFNFGLVRSNGFRSTKRTALIAAISFSAGDAAGGVCA